MEQLKIGDKVKILWEITRYSGTHIYKRSGVIIDINSIHDDNGKSIFDVYEVGDILYPNEKYTLNFTKDELVKIPEITEPLEKRDFAQDIAKYALQTMLNRKIKVHANLKDWLGNMEKYALHIQGQWLGNMEETVLRYTLPTKVVFDINKRKTTLLFGDKPYEHKVSGIAHKSDTFDTASGFFIQLAKHILRDKWQDKMKIWDYLSNSDFNTVKMMIFNFVLTHLKEELGMSFRQLDKLSKWNFKVPLTFEIKGIKHTIEVEHKFDLTKKQKGESK